MDWSGSVRPGPDRSGLGPVQVRPGSGPVVVDTSDDASMDEIYVTYVDDEHVDNHDYDDTTDDDHDNNNDIYVSGPDPGRTRTGPRPDRS